ncbi:MAG: PHB depolymerase family esterase [Acidobacteriota bacterium]
MPTSSWRRSVGRWTGLGPAEPTAPRFCWRLAIGLVLLAVLPVAGQDLRALNDDLGKALRAEQWQKAVEIAGRIVRLQPEDPTAHYNMACALALSGREEVAIMALRSAAELGFASLETLRHDTDIESIRDHPDFPELAQKIAATHQRELEIFRQRVAQSEPLIFAPPTEGEPGAEPVEPMPLVVMLHGSGGQAGRLADLWRESAAKIGAVLVTPEGFEPRGKGFRWSEPERTTRRVLHAIDYAAERFPIDRQRVIVGGFSQGASMALFSSVLQAGTFAGVIAIGACSEEGFGLGQGPASRPLPIYIGIGSEDRAHPHCRPMAKRYRDAGFDVKLRVYQGYGHVFPQNYRWEFDRALVHILGKPARR